MTNCCQRQ